MKDENWALPVLFVLCIDLRLFAISVSNAMYDLIHADKAFIISSLHSNACPEGGEAEGE